MSRARRAVVLAAALLLCPIAMLAIQQAISRDWVPDLPNETIVFLNYRIHDAMGWFHRVAFVDAVWTGIFLAVVFLANELRSILGRRFLTTVMLAQAFSLVVMAASPFPMDSDQFAYVYYGDLTLRGVSPYTAYTNPLALAPQEARIAVHWQNPPLVDRYGPAWTLGNAALLAPFQRASAEFQARMVRIFAACAALLCTLLLAVTLPKVPWRDSALLAFALNPLVIVAVGNGGHNDIYLVLFGLLTWWLATRGRFEPAAAALATSVSVKFAYLPLLPVLLAYAFIGSRSWVRAATTAFVFAATVVVFSLPLGMRDSLFGPVSGWAGDLPRVEYYVWRVVAHLPHMHGIPSNPFGLIFPALVAICALAIAAFALKRERVPRLEITLGVLMLMLPYKIESWYALVLTPLLLVPNRFALLAFLAITAACEFLTVRLFLAASEPYLQFAALAVLIVIMLDEIQTPQQRPFMPADVR